MLNLVDIFLHIRRNCRGQREREREREREAEREREIVTASEKVTGYSALGSRSLSLMI